MKLIPSKLAIGSHRIADAPPAGANFSSLIHDDIARYACTIHLSRGGYQIVDGKREKRYFSRLGEVRFSQDGRGHAYEFENYNGVVLNGRKKFGRGHGSFRFHGSAEHWTCRKYGKGGSARLITHRGTDRLRGSKNIGANARRHLQLPPHPPTRFLPDEHGINDHDLNGDERFTPNGKHLICTAHPETKLGVLMCDDNILYDGSVIDVSDACNRFPYVSWIGEDPKDTDRYFVYLLGQRREKVPPYYEAWTFEVSHDHKRWMYGAADEEVNDANGNFVGEQFLYLDGKRQPRAWREVVWGESVFSPNTKRWSHVGRDPSGRCHAIIDGKEIGDFEVCLDNQFSAFSRRHGFIAYESGAKDRKGKDYCFHRPLTHGFVVVDGKVYDPGSSVRDCSLTFSPNEKHFSYISQTNPADKGPWRIHLDGKVIDEAERIFGQEQGLESRPRFSADAKRLYYFSFKDGDLRFNVADVGRKS